MKGILFDTDVIIDILRAHQKTIDQVIEKAQHASAFCSCVSIGEIFAGMRKDEEKRTRDVLESFIKISVDEEVAEVAGRLKNETKSHSLFLDDCLIAATALVHGYSLMTKNTKHYPFSNLNIYKII